MGAKAIILNAHPKDAMAQMIRAKRRLDGGWYDDDEFAHGWVTGGESLLGVDYWTWHQEWWEAHEWNRDGILWVHFEDFTTDPINELKRILKFLHINSWEHTDEF